MIINFDHIKEEFQQIHGGHPAILDVGHSENLLRVLVANDEVVAELPATFTHSETGYEIGIEYNTLERIQRRQAYEEKEKAAKALLESVKRDEA